MRPQERIRWFWSTGVLPGTLFDDMEDQRNKAPRQSRRRLAKRLQLGFRKRT